MARGNTAHIKALKAIEACDCTFGGMSGAMHPETHRRLLSIEKLPALEALRLAVEVAEGDTYEGIEVGELLFFVAQHSWRDPVAMAELAYEIDQLGLALRDRYPARPVLAAC